jgi:hypothetical protein
MSAQTSQQITEWLEKLGMPEYAQRFTENGTQWCQANYLVRACTKSGCCGSGRHLMSASPSGGQWFPIQVHRAQARSGKHASALAT